METSTKETSDQFCSELEDLYNHIVKVHENFKKCPKSRLTKGYLEARIQCLDEYWISYRNAHRSLLKLVPRDKRKQFDYFVNDEYSACEEIFMQTKADIKDALSSVLSPTSPVRTSRKDDSTISTTHTSQVKLPRIELKSFSGADYQEWPNFQDMFTSLVHQDKSLSNVQKLHYLKSSVTGEAEALLKHVQITADNYELAWNILKVRYSNKRVIVASLFKRLVNQRKIVNQTALQIKSLHDTTMECLNSLNNLGINTDTWDPLVIFLVVQKLDNETHKEWEDRVSKEDSDTLPTLSMLMKFLESRFRMLELLTPALSKDKVVRERSLHVSTAERNCLMCHGNHALYHCKELGKMEPVQRGEFVKNKNICYNCLVPGHSVKSCRLSTSCRICRKRHHTLLHQPRSTTSTQGPSSTNNQPKVSPNATVEETEVETRVNTVMTPNSQQYTGNKNKLALLATAVVTVRSEEGFTTVLRALIDPGSESCFITERAAQLLMVRRHAVKGSILGMGSMKSRITQVVQVEVSSKCSQFNLRIEAYVINKQLTTEIPKRTITNHNWPHITGLTLADPNFYKPGSIDLLLGHDEYAQILQDGLIKGPPGSPCAQNTSLGWILFGRVDHDTQPENNRSVTVMHNQIEMEDMLKVLWEIDTNDRRRLTKEEETCEKIYQETHTRNKEGRYIVKLPFKTDKPKSIEGNTRSIAMKRLEYLERRLNNNKELKEAYTEVMEEYLKMGHMEEVPANKILNNAVYLPHHAVVRSDKETTRTRVVFDASCKGQNGISLNDELLVGPVLQEDLRSIIMRWRLHRICFASDIEKMYRMVLVTKDSSDFQRVLWRQNTSTFEEIKDYRLLTVTFGTSSAPYLAVRTLIQLADDEGKRYPAAARIIKEDCYVDDVMSGCDTVSEAIEISKQLEIILSKGKFTLKKWTSNSVEFLSSIDPDKRSAKASLDLKIDGTVKALGLSWNLGEDEFQYNLTMPPLTHNVTKRSILADLQRLFDPLGWIAPIVVKAKLLVQKLWLLGVGWDEPIDENLDKQWRELRNDVFDVNDIKIKRWLDTQCAAKNNTSLHGFSDASMHAISAVVYCRTTDSNGHIRTSIVAARTKVAPVKPVSIPRLELCGAVLVAKLLNHAAQAMRIPSTQIYAWTDSSITLSWLFGEPNRWKPFVANRVVEILENVNASQWHHVESENNPADIASRGATTSELHNSQLWWNGPKFLSEKEIEFKRPKIKETDIEKRKTRILLNIEENEKTGFFENYDKLVELQRTIAYCRRFLNYKKINDMEESITTEELDKALKICIRKSQIESFATEIESITKHREVKKTSNLRALNPYLDGDQILRVGGRLRHANISLENKHPIILDHKHGLTSLIIADAHQKTLHGGIQLMLCHLRCTYWIIRAKGAVKSHLHGCLVCAKLRAKTRSQIMGDLPKARVTPARAFLHSGVDFAGPYNILFCKGRGGKTTKAYISIFICMCTKAIHLELVGDLTSEAFIGAFRRFVARRGRCAHIWSDQGRNFIGANKDLVNAWNEANLEFKGQISDSLAQEGTQWHFIPPYSPTFGGLWESGVKSLKHHLRRVLTTNLTYEEMSTLLCEIEAFLNSRPLCPIDDDDVDNLNPLTPGHFLIGESPAAVPTPAQKNVNVTYLSRWRYTQRLLRDLWQRWQQEYLSRLQQRPKWLKKREEFQINDIVLIKQDNLPPGKWLLGRVVAKHPGPDNITRVYSVKSGDTITKRCVSKLCFLPLTESQNS